MSSTDEPRDRPGVPSYTVPHAERYVLEADALRRRQLRSALLHGSRRTWREHRRVWPAVVVGIVVIAVVLAAMAIQWALTQGDGGEDEAAGPALVVRDDDRSGGQWVPRPPIMAPPALPGSRA